MTSALTSSSLPLLPSFRRQQLLLEYALLKHHCPEGLYLTPNPNDPACWSGVYFVQQGPYSAAILRFELLFPPSYPEAPPLVIFSTEIFHPLLVPLTTYTFSPGASDSFGTYSPSETERLPPGALSLKHGFPRWFQAAERGRTSVRNKGTRERHNSDDVETPSKLKDEPVLTGLPVAAQSKNESPTISLLEYIKSAFEDEHFLDDLPIDAVGNPNAWHAWRSHRGLSRQTNRAQSPSPINSARAGVSPRDPAQWNWDGVWEARVRSGIDESASDALLFSSKNTRGGTLSTDPIRFSKFDDEKLAAVQNNMLRMYRFSVDASNDKM